MGFLDAAEKMIDQGVAGAKKGTKALALKTQISEVVGRRELNCAQFGAELYEEMRNNPEFRASHEAFFTSIEGLDAQINALRSELAYLENPPQGAPVSDAEMPPQGAPVSADTSQPVPAQPGPPQGAPMSDAAIPPQGAPLSSDQAFAAPAQPVAAPDAQAAMPALSDAAPAAAPAAVAAVADVASKPCASCGQLNSPESTFCGSCGAKL